MERTENEEFDRLSEKIEKLGLGLSSLTSSDFSQYSPTIVAVQYDRLADLYWSRYQLSGEENDLDCCRRSSLAAASHGNRIDHTEHGRQLSVVQRYALQATRLGTAFDRFGDTQDLDKSIAVFQTAIAVSDDHIALRSTLLTNQANYLCMRYEAGGPPEDIEKAIQGAKKALENFPSGKSTVQNNLSTMYFAKWEREKALTDLKHAVAHAESAVAETADVDPKLPTRLLNWANALCALYTAEDGLDDPQQESSIDRAIRGLERAVYVCGQADQSLRVQALTKLARAYRLRFNKLKQEGDIRAAVGAANGALRLFHTAANSESRPQMDTDLAEILRVCTHEAQVLDDRRARNRCVDGPDAGLSHAEGAGDPPSAR